MYINSNNIYMIYVQGVKLLIYRVIFAHKLHINSFLHINYLCASCKLVFNRLENLIKILFSIG